MSIEIRAVIVPLLCEPPLISTKEWFQGEKREGQNSIESTPLCKTHGCSVQLTILIFTEKRDKRQSEIDNPNEVPIPSGHVVIPTDNSKMIDNPNVGPGPEAVIIRFLRATNVSTPDPFLVNYIMS